MCLCYQSDMSPPASIILIETALEISNTSPFLIPELLTREHNDVSPNRHN